jgi:hypothetical protein
MMARELEADADADSDVEVEVEVEDGEDPEIEGCPCGDPTT